MQQHADPTARHYRLTRRRILRPGRHRRERLEYSNARKTGRMGVRETQSNRSAKLTADHSVSLFILKDLFSFATIGKCAPPHYGGAPFSQDFIARKSIASSYHFGDGRTEERTRKAVSAQTAQHPRHGKSSGNGCQTNIIRRKSPRLSVGTQSIIRKKAPVCSEGMFSDYPKRMAGAILFGQSRCYWFHENLCYSSKYSLFQQVLFALNPGCYPSLLANACR